MNIHNKSEREGLRQVNVKYDSECCSKSSFPSHANRMQDAARLVNFQVSMQMQMHEKEKREKDQANRKGKKKKTIFQTDLILTMVPESACSGELHSFSQ